MLIKNTLKPTEFYKCIMVYGPSGNGKTEFIGSASRKYKTVLFDFERGSSTLEGRYDVDVVEIRDKEGLDFVEKAITGQNNFLDPYKIVGFDGLNGYYLLKSNLELYDFKQFKRKKDNLYLNDRGSLFNDVMLTLTHLKDLRKMSIVTCASVVKQDEDMGSKVQPYLPGQLANVIGQIFDGYYFLDVIKNPIPEEEVKKPFIRVLYTQPTENYNAKNRLVGIPPVIIADYPHLIGLYLSELKRLKEEGEKNATSESKS